MNVGNIVIMICEFSIRMLFTIIIVQIYWCSNLLWLICLREITIIIIWYCYTNKCGKWYMKSNTKSNNWVCIGDKRWYRRPFPL